MTTLKSSLESLAASFAEEIVRAIRGASLQELLGEVAGTRARQSSSATPSHAPLAAASPASRSSHQAVVPGSAVLRRGRLKRRNADDIASTLGRIVTLLKSNPAGLRAEQIRKELGMLSKELPRPLAEGLASKALRKKGQKRATVYFAGGTTPPASADAPRVTAGRKKK